MYSNSKEASLSDSVSKQLKYDDDNTEDTGRRVKVNKEEKKKNEKKMYEHKDETAAGRPVKSKKVSKGSSSTTPKDKTKNIDTSTTPTYERSELTEA